MSQGDAIGGHGTVPVRRLLTAAVAAIAIAALVGMAGGVEAAETDEPALVVDVDAEGDATVTLVATYELTDDEEREAFETLQEDEEARAAMAERFDDRMTVVAEDASAATDREMSVADASVDLDVEDDVGIARLSVGVTNLAAVDGDAVVVDEPFASGFSPDRPLTIAGPDGYDLAEASPSADSIDDGAATWTAGSDLTGFEATFASADGANGDDTTEDGTEDADAGDDSRDDADDGDAGADVADDEVPGFGIAAAVVALVVAIAAAVHRG